jgi:cell division protein FtsZ
MALQYIKGKEVTMHNFNDIPQSVVQIRIMVAGIGGAGLNALNAMLAAGLDGVETVGISCSVPRLRRSRAGRTLQIGSDQRGFGTGGNPAVARTAAEQSSNELRRLLAGVDLLLLTAGLGSGTGTGATPVVARLARESGALVVGLVTRPFSREGRHRAALARQGVRELLSVVDSLIVIPNDRLISQASRGMSLLEAFRPADQLLQQAVQGIVEVVTGCGQGIVEVVTGCGHINVDFSDLRTVLAARGMALIGIGTASGENRAVAAATQAIANPLLEELDLSDARGLLLNISGSSSMTLDEYDQVCRTITEQLAEDAVMVVGMVLDASLAERIRVTVIATGIRLADDLAGVGTLRLMQGGGCDVKV